MFKRNMPEIWVITNVLLWHVYCKEGCTKSIIKSPAASKRSENYYETGRTIRRGCVLHSGT